MPANDLLFELGCEEIPAKMLARALAELPAAVEAKLSAARLTYASVRALGTPRRLAVIVKGLGERQPDLDEEVVGPPVGAAFAPDGTLTKAGQGFAAKNGVGPEAIEKKEVAGKKGLYAVARRHVAGTETRALLPELLRELVTSIPWPKSMRWGWTETAFVRPVQWLVALYGVEVVPLTWAGQTSSRNSRGHRFLSNRAIEIASADKYVETLHAANVIVDPETRRIQIESELKRLESETGYRIRPDKALLDEVVNLGEYPKGVSGGFNPAFLEVPEEIIVTAMRTHQRYFAMEDAQGKLAPRFATMMATVVKDPAVVAAGNETVLASRLSDARFFFTEDKKKSFDDWNGKLEGVVFQAKLGDKAKTIGHKVQRLSAIVAALGGSDVAKKAAAYAKSDLASHAVGEFPEVQGTMGKHYANIAGFGREVADAIEQHWWPKGQGAELPKTDDAAMVALADRMDTIVGCFAVGLEPSGSADPFALRRAAAKAAMRLAAFFKPRLRGILFDEGLAAQEVDAALAQDFSDPVDARARAVACAKISKEAREVFKRVANILDDARGKKLAIPTAVDRSLFVHPSEHALHDAVTGAKADSSDYAKVFESLETLRPAVAAFFDKGGVMVMDPDPKLRDNRLALLGLLIAPYARIADFRLLAGAAA